MTASFVEPGSGRVRPGHPAVAPLEQLVAGAGDDVGRLLATLREHGIPAVAVADLVAGMATTAEWGEAVARSRHKGERLRRATERAEAALAALGDQVALPGSSLGPAWSSDVDMLIRAAAVEEAEAALLAAGFLDLNPLLARLGRETADVRRFGAVAEGEVLGSVELCLRLHDDGPLAERAIDRAVRPAPGALPRLTPPDRALRRCGKVAARRHVRVRDVLELAALQEEGADLSHTGVTRVAARRCAELSDELAGTRSGRGRPAASPVWVKARARGVRRKARRALRSGRLVVAFTGIDGSGKSTQAALLTESLDRVSIPSRAGWARIGFSGLPVLSLAARLGQRVLPPGSHSAQRARAGGVAGGSTPLTRRGALGWSWALAVTLAYLRNARRAARGPRGTVIVFDRALPDALVDLDQGFGGALDLRLQRRLVARLSPRADVVFHLRLPGAAAHARKADMFVPEVLDRYARRYEAVLQTLPGAIVLEAERPADRLAAEVLSTVAAGIDRPSRRAPVVAIPG